MTLATGVSDPETSSHRHGPPDQLVNGVRVGRYVVLRTVGVGAMGTVYLAYDPELDRRVALKLLRRGKSPKKRLALLREAQAMAKLTHPRVVSVYDTGEHEGSVYVAMEFVEGVTLAKWLRSGSRPGGRRPWRDVVRAFLQAGQGLVAAHERGLVHRDFKPHNVMVSSDGSVRVMDFGLARPGAESTDDLSEGGELSGSLLTEATVGRVAGTPAYMAPEQGRAERIGPAADQFAFCVSLWEGLCGERPFAGASAAEAFTNASEGRLRPVPAGTRIPRWLRRTLRRGLSVDAARRWPSMSALLGTLERGLSRWRWQLGLGLLAATAVPLGGAMLRSDLAAREHAARVAACWAEGSAIDEVWNKDARERLRRGLLDTGAPFAAQSVDTLVPWLDDYRTAWRVGRSEACMMRTVQQVWSDEQLDRAMWCFEDRRLQLESTVDQITRGDVKAARRAVRLASYLDPVEACLDPKLLARLPAPPPQMRDDVRRIRADLNRSDALRHGGMMDEALAVAQQARAEAEALGWPPLLASARFLEGRCALEAGRPLEADAALTDAYFRAHDAGSLEVAFRAARSLLKANTNLRRYTQAEVWAGHADVLAAGLVDRGGLDEAEGHYLRSSVYRGMGDYAAAAREGQLAYEQRARVLGPDHPITAAALGVLGRAYLGWGRPQEALVFFERAYDVWRTAVGPHHPHVGGYAVLRGAALRQLGEPEEALALIREGLSNHEEAYVADHPKLMADLEELGRVLTDLGQVQEAEFALGRAQAIRDAQPHAENAAGRAPTTAER